jgi:hypothetical protein
MQQRTRGPDDSRSFMGHPVVTANDWRTDSNHSQMDSKNMVHNPGDELEMDSDYYRMTWVTIPDQLR